MAKIISRQQLIITALLGAFIILVFVNVGPAVKSYHNLDSASFAKLSRQEQVKVCGSCHVQAYENEMKGPHTNAYVKLAEHIAFVNSPAYKQPEYTRFVNLAKDKCAGCHAPQNLFETVYKGLAQADDLKMQQLLTNGLPMPEVRKDSMSLITGVDCMSCHFDGKQVIAVAGSKGVKKDSCPDFCSPVGSKFFASDLSCMSCHSEAVTSQHNNLPVTAIKQNTCSGSCHQQFSGGSPTHYYYWLNDPADKKRSPAMGGIFETLFATYDKKQVTISWQNKCTGHQMNECREIIATADVLDKNDSLLVSSAIRLNRKEFHDKSTLQQFFGSNKIPGVSGHEFKNMNDSVMHVISLPENTEAYKIKITGSHKAQYWLPDSFAVPVYKKEFLISR